MNPNIHPLEFLGLYIRWKLIGINDDSRKNRTLTFEEFKKNRIGIGDFFVGSIALFLIILIPAFLYALIK